MSEKRSIVDTHPECLKYWDKETNEANGIYPKDFIVGSHKKVYWLCDKHGSYEQSIREKLKGRTCVYCSGRKTHISESIVTTHPQLLSEWDYVKNNELGIYPEECKKTSKKVVYWKCDNKKHSSFKKAINIKHIGEGCLVCKSISCTHPELLDEWDYEKNDKLGIFPDKVSYGSKKKVYFICKEHGSYLQTIHKRFLGHKCAICSNQKIILENSIVKTHPYLLDEWDYETNAKLGYFPENYSYGTLRKVYWKCEKHGSYLQDIASKVYKNCGCSYCSNSKTHIIDSIYTTHPHLLTEWDYIENDKLGISPKEVSFGSDKEVYWKCKKHGSYKLRINHKVNGVGCSSCSESKGEKEINTLLIDKNILFEREMSFKDCIYKAQLFFDFYIEEKRFIIEYNGRQHYHFSEFMHKTNEKFEEYILRDNIKRDYCLQNKIALLEIPYTEFDNIESIILEVLLKSEELSKTAFYDFITNYTNTLKEKVLTS